MWYTTQNSCLYQTVNWDILTWRSKGTDMLLGVSLKWPCAELHLLYLSSLANAAEPKPVGDVQIQSCLDFMSENSEREKCLTWALTPQQQQFILDADICTHTYNLYYRCKLLLHMWPLHSPPRSADCLHFFLPSSLVDFFPLCASICHSMYSGDSYLQPSTHADAAGKKPGTYAVEMRWQTKLRKTRQHSQSPSPLAEIEHYILQAWRTAEGKKALCGWKQKTRERNVWTDKKRCLSAFLSLFSWRENIL